MPAGSLPFVQPPRAPLGELPTPPGWAHEFKWDGVRTVVYLDGGRIRAASRNDCDVIGTHPELLPSPTGPPAVGRSSTVRSWPSINANGPASTCCGSACMYAPQRPVRSHECRS